MSRGPVTESDLDVYVKGRWRREACCVTKVKSVLATRVTLFHVKQGGEEESVVGCEQRPSDQSDLDACVTGRWGVVCYTVRNTSLFYLIRD